jgi:hypothetical protein
VQTIVEFNERTGPKRVLDASNNAVNFFQMFYTDKVFQHIVECTNTNAELKRGGADPDKRSTFHYLIIWTIYPQLLYIKLKTNKIIYKNMQKYFNKTCSLKKY